MQGFPQRLKAHLDKLNEVVATNMQVNIAKRKQQSLSSVHYLCFLLDPRFVSMDILMQDEKNMALELARELHPDMLATIKLFKVKEGPSTPIILKQHLRYRQQLGGS